MRNDSRLFGWGLTAALAAAVFWFWLMPFRCFLSYHEQYQLFLFTSDYFLERIALPGGLVDYVSEFLVQLFFVPTLGAGILALLFAGIQRLTWALSRDYGAADWCFPLSFVPAFALWVLMSDENVLPTYALAVGAALALSHLCNCLSRPLPKLITLFAGLTVGYWLIGPATFILAVNALFAIWSKKASNATSASSEAASSPWLILAIVAAALLPPILSHIALPYELRRFFTGVNYFRYPTFNTTAEIVVSAVFAFTPLACGVMGRCIFLRKKLATMVVLAVAVAAAGGTVVFGSFNSTKTELIKYDFLVRGERWDDLIKMAEKRPPMTPLGVSCLNLALSQRGLLAERLFEFFQNGGDGLFPPFVRNMTSPVPTAETFFRLGMVNDAHRYFFEAQESIPNYRKSGRLMRRLVMCEIVNGEYEVARKWLRILAKSLFYRDWAERMLALLDDEGAMEKDEVIAAMRAKRQTEDYLFSDAEMDQMLGMLFVRNNSNRMAYEYLMCYVLLQKDVEKFMKYYPIGRLAGYSRIPTVFQEVLVGVALQRNPDPKAIPYSVDSGPLNNTMGFIRLYMQDRNNVALDERPYSSNAWNYLLRGGAVRERNVKSKEGIY